MAQQFKATVVAELRKGSLRTIESQIKSLGKTRIVLNNVRIHPKGLRAQVTSQLNKTPIRLSNVTINKGALNKINSQLQSIGKKPIVLKKVKIDTKAAKQYMTAQMAKTPVSINNIKVNTASIISQVQAALNASTFRLNPTPAATRSMARTTGTIGTVAGKSASTNFNKAFVQGFKSGKFDKQLSQAYQRMGKLDERWDGSKQQSRLNSYYTGMAKAQTRMAKYEAKSKAGTTSDAFYRPMVNSAAKDFERNSTKFSNAYASMFAQQRSFASETDKLASSNKMGTWLENNSKASKTFGTQIRYLQQQAQSAVTSGDLKKINTQFKGIQQQAIATGNVGRTMAQGIGASFKSIGRYVGASTVIYGGMASVASMASNVIEVNEQMIELKKVTDASNEAYSNFMKTAETTSIEIGASLSEYIASTADFGRLGYSLGDAAELARVANIYYTVGDEIDDIDSASKSIISTMSAFKDYSQVEDSMQIIDKFNEVGNNFAISSGGLGEAMKRSAASLAAGNNSLDESLALAVGGNTVIQNPEKVGTALKTIAMNIGSADKAGSKLRDTILEITANTSKPVDIMQKNGKFKSTYQVLKELAGVYGELSDEEARYLTQKIAGKHHGNVAESILNNFDKVEKAKKTAETASEIYGGKGSATRELEKALGGLRAKLNQLTAAWQAFSEAFMGSKFLGGAIDAGTQVLTVLTKIVNTIGALPTILAGVGIGKFIADIVSMNKAMKELAALEAMSEAMGGGFIFAGSSRQTRRMAKASKAAKGAKVTTKAGKTLKTGQRFAKAGRVAEGAMGAAVTADSIKNITKGTKATSKLGAAAKVTGGYASKLGGAFGAISAFLVSNPWVAAAAGVAVLGGAMYALYRKSHQYELQVDNLEKKTKQNNASVRTQYESAQRYTAKLKELSKVEQKNTFQKSQMAEYVEKLNDIYPSLNLQYDKTKDKIFDKNGNPLIFGDKNKEGTLEYTIYVKYKTVKDDVHEANAEKFIKKATKLEDKRANKITGKEGTQYIAEAREGYLASGIPDQAAIALNQYNKAIAEARSLTEQQNRCLIDAQKEYNKVSMATNEYTKSLEKTQKANPDWDMSSVIDGVKQGLYAAPLTKKDWETLFNFDQTAKELEGTSYEVGDSVLAGIEQGIYNGGSYKISRAGLMKLVRFDNAYNDLYNAGVEMSDNVISGFEGSSASVKKSFNQVLEKAYAGLTDGSIKLGDVQNILGNSSLSTEQMTLGLNAVLDVEYTASDAETWLKENGFGDAHITEEGTVEWTNEDGEVETWTPPEKEGDVDYGVGSQEEPKTEFTGLQTISLDGQEYPVETFNGQQYITVGGQQYPITTFGGHQYVTIGSQQYPITTFTGSQTITRQTTGYVQTTYSAVQYIKRIFTGGDGLRGAARPGGGTQFTRANKNPSFATGNSVLTSDGEIIQRDDWRTRSSGMALFGEEGQELIVRGDNWITVGEKSAEFAPYRKGDIIFDARQTKELLNKGRIEHSNPRGRAYAHGTTKGKAFKKKTYKETVDLVERLLDNVDRKLKKLQNKVDNIFKSFTKRLADFPDLIAAAKNKVEKSNKAADTYKEKANAVKYKNSKGKKVSIESSIIKQIQDGSFDIKTYSAKGKAGNRKIEAIKKYIDYWDKYQDALEDANDAEAELRDLYQEQLDLIEDKYDAETDLIDATTERLETMIDLQEANGQFASASLYNQLIANEQTIIDAKIAEYQAVLNAMEVAKKAGMTEGSELWYQYQQKLAEINNKILECKVNMAEWQQDIRQLDWDKFDYLQDRISVVADEFSFLIDMLDEEDFFDDNGNMTNTGYTAIALHQASYEVMTAQAKQYADEIAKLNSQIAADPSNTELAKRKMELVSAQQDVIKSAKAEKDAMKEVIKDGIDAQIDAMDELIKKYEDSLDSAKDLYDYQSKIKDLSTNITTIEKQLMAYQGDDSAETRAVIQKLNAELKDAKEDLKDEEYDRYISSQKELLGNLQDEYEELLNSRLDNIDNYLSGILSEIDTKGGEISGVLSSLGSEIGYSVSQAIAAIDFGGGTVIDGVTTDVGNSGGGTTTTITTGTEELEGEAPAEEDTEDANPPADETPNPRTDGVVQAGDSPTLTSSAKVYNKKGKKKKKMTNKYRKKKVYVSSINNKSKGAKYNYYIRTKKGGSGIGYISSKSSFKSGSYSEGGFVADMQRMAYRNGDDMVAFNTLKRGEAVLTPAQAQQFKALTENLPQLSSIVDIGGYLAQATSGSTYQNNSNVDVGGVNINIPIEHVDDYNDFMAQIQKDPKFEQLIQSMSIDLLSGRSSLAKNNIKL